MRLSSALQWWEEWQLRILVLSSQVVHWILFFAVWVRTLHVLRRLKPVIWIAYIGGDALAIYALATLFNRHKQQTLDSESASLEIIWAPVLLIHLGGQKGISAYGLEDNELWKRHVITLVSQVIVAVYVFCKWWSGGERMLVAAVLLFILGVVKFSQKPWALKRASFTSMLASTNVSPPMELNSGMTCWKLCTLSLMDMFKMMENEEKSKKGEEQLNLSIEEYVQQAKKCTHATEVASAQEDALKIDKRFVDALDNVYRMFVDTFSPYSERLKDLQFFLKCDDEHTHKLCGHQLLYVFKVLYTRTRLSFSLLGGCLPLFLPVLPITSLVLFAQSNKDYYNKSDVMVTYIMFACAVAQELLPASSFLHRTLSKLTSCHDMVSQCSIMSFYVRKKNPTILMKLATLDSLREYINKHCYIWHAPAGLQVTGLVGRYVKDGWKNYIHDVARYKRFNNLRGQWTLRKKRQPQLAWSLNKQFDHSVILWHTATDLCFHRQSTTTSRSQECVSGSRVISNYMMYLLSVHPEMLMSGIRPGIFDVASYELEHILSGSKLPLDNEQALAQEIMDMVKSSTTSTPVPEQELAHTIEEMEQRTTVHTTEEKYTVHIIPAACRLADELMKLEEESRWAVIQGVWVEMLCYSASRCRGYLHAKSLGEGRECLTTVWLLWSYLGMETFANMIQSPELQEEEDDDDDSEGKEKEEGTSPQFHGQADQYMEIIPV